MQRWFFMPNAVVIALLAYAFLSAVGLATLTVIYLLERSDGRKPRSLAHVLDRHGAHGAT
jgi:hypothetical protein